MTIPRALLVDHLSVGVYHCTSRCVRRESLLAEPERAEWLVARLDVLRHSFAIDVCDFAVMSNHMHLLLRILPDLAMALDAEEVARRWMTICPPRHLRRRTKTLDCGDPGAPPTSEEIAIALSDPECIAEWRARLSDLGWFHRLLKEPCARIWNAVDDVSGHFWEGRYHSSACPRDNALLSAAAYILLNPVHCGAEDQLVANPRTSIGRRLEALRKEIERGAHTRGVATYERALVEPALPCVRGSAAEITDEEYHSRLAGASRLRGLREEALDAARDRLDAATRFEADSLGEQARDAEPHDASVVRTIAYAQPDERARLLRSRSPLRSRGKRRTSSRTPPASIAGRRNPWRDAIGLPLIEGCTLEAFIEMVDSAGRVQRRDKPGRIAADTPRAVARMRSGTAVPTGRPVAELAHPSLEHIGDMARRGIEAALGEFARWVAPGG